MRLFFGWFVITSVVDNRFEVQKKLSFSYKKKKVENNSSNFLLNFVHSYNNSQFCCDMIALQTCFLVSENPILR